jgi:hypothetical protein
MRKITFLLLVIFMSSFILAIKIIPIQEILKPVTINLDNDQIYITEGASIYIYSLKDFKFVKKFGKEGEGPQEFKLIPLLPLIINVQTDKILVNSLGKISRFTKDGQFIDEEKMKAGFVAGLQPLGNRFVGLGIMQDSNTRYRAVNIYDSKLNKIIEMIKVEDEEKEISQWFIFDLKGKLLKKVQLPMKYQNALKHFPYAIHDDKFYQVVENIEEEQWELHITPLNY